jgi:hypothetical protein
MFGSSSFSFTSISFLSKYSAHIGRLLKKTNISFVELDQLVVRKDTDVNEHEKLSTLH